MADIAVTTTQYIYIYIYHLRDHLIHNIAFQGELSKMISLAHFSATTFKSNELLHLILSSQV